MRKLIVNVGFDRVGCEGTYSLIVDDDTTQDEMDRIAFDMAVEHAGQYVDVVEYYEDNEDQKDCVALEDIWGHAEDYDPEKHDDLKPGGGTWQNDFN